MAFVRTMGGWVAFNVLGSSGWPSFSGLVLEKVGSLFLWEPSAALTQYLRNISRRVNDTNDLQWLCLWTVHDPIIPVRLRQPEAQRQRSQVFPYTPGKWSIRKESASGIDRLFNAIRSFGIVLGDVAPDFKKVFNCLRGELVKTHASRLSSSQARFLFSTAERTWSEPINSPRCEAA